MIERDYMMRMITMLAQLLARVLLHKKAYDFPQARKELQSAYRGLLGITPELAHQFSDIRLAEMFGNDKDIKAMKCFILGSLMKEEGEILLLEDDKNGGDQLFLRSVSLLLTSFNTAQNEAAPGHLDKIDELLAALSGAELPAHVNDKLLTCYELAGKYDKAENVLFELVQADPSWVPQGLRFYERLLKHSDDELKARGLSRIEAIQGMDELRQHAQ